MMTRTLPLPLPHSLSRAHLIGPGEPGGFVLEQLPQLGDLRLALLLRDVRQLLRESLVIRLRLRLHVVELCFHLPNPDELLIVDVAVPVLVHQAHHGVQLCEQNGITLFEWLPYVCPEPVLAKMISFISKRYPSQKDCRLLTCLRDLLANRLQALRQLVALDGPIVIDVKPATHIVKPKRSGN
jgi:hypothetical protein